MRKAALYAFTSCLILGSAVASFAAAAKPAAAPAASKAAPAASSAPASATPASTDKKAPATTKKHKHHTATKATTAPKPGSSKN